MPELASLDLIIRDGMVVHATQSLQGLVGASVNAEAATTSLGGASLGTERAVSRLSFGLTNMARSSASGTLGLRSVEMGMMSLLPGLGWGLVAVTGLIEGYEMLSKKLDLGNAALEKFASTHRAWTSAPSGAATTPAERLRAAGAYLTVNPGVTERIMRIYAEEAAAAGELTLGGAGVAAAGRASGRGAERLVREVLSHVKRKPVH